jgi:hypothetical protein
MTLRHRLFWAAAVAAEKSAGSPIQPLRVVKDARSRRLSRIPSGLRFQGWRVRETTIPPVAPSTSLSRSKFATDWPQACDHPHIPHMSTLTCAANCRHSPAHNQSCNLLPPFPPRLSISFVERHMAGRRPCRSSQASRQPQLLAVSFTNTCRKSRQRPHAPSNQHFQEELVHSWPSRGAVIAGFVTKCFARSVALMGRHSRLRDLAARTCGKR